MRIQEELFEAARAEAFPGTVSRCNCIFAFESEAALDAFIGERNLAYERYEIRPADGSPPLEARDLDIMDDVVRHVENKAVPLNIPWIVQQALRYYGQEPPRSGRYELLIEGAVEIVRRLDT